MGRREREDRRAPIREARAKLIADLDAAREAEARGEAPAVVEPAGSPPATEPAPAPIPASAVVDDDMVDPADAPVPGVPDRFEAMSDDVLREFIAKAGERVDGRWKRDMLLSKARAVGGGV